METIGMTNLTVLVFLFYIILAIGFLALIAIVVVRAVKGKDQRVYNKNEDANQTKE